MAVRLFDGGTAPPPSAGKIGPLSTAGLGVVSAMGTSPTQPRTARALTFGTTLNAANDPPTGGASGNNAVDYGGITPLTGVGILGNLVGSSSFQGSFGGETSVELPATRSSSLESATCPADANSGGVAGPANAGAAETCATEKDVDVAPTDDNLHGRPPGDTRSAGQIINENDVLKNLGNQKDIKVDQLKARFGDWTADNKDPKSRADAAYNMAKVLNSIKALKNRENGDRGEVHTNGKIEGITKSGDARHGTEAGVLKDIAEQGLSALPQNRQLPATKDTHVRLDGTNKDNFQWAMGRIGNFLSHIPILKSIAAPFFNNIGEARNLGEVFSGGLKGLAQGALSISRGPVGWAMTAVTDTAQIVVEDVADEKQKKRQS